MGYGIAEEIARVCGNPRLAQRRAELLRTACRDLRQIEQAEFQMRPCRPDVTEECPVPSADIDWDEYSKIFPKKGGLTAMSPLPGGIPGSREGTPQGVNPVTHRLVDGKPVRRPIEDAKRLLAEAGYPDGRDAATGRPLPA